MDERLEKINPAKTVAQLMYIIDSYPSDHGACPATYHLSPMPNVCTKNSVVKSAKETFENIAILNLGFNIFTKLAIRRTNPIRK
ncbi:MAG: hypothetical protein A2525_09035 [Sulfurimonas sp. RIFOXYD12_FULL_36_11]|nr:MAG: hypothetical protein A2525_09035 [Sulfurimonas sp. RIFOXYD12_FULL_36_11]